MDPEVQEMLKVCLDLVRSSENLLFILRVICRTDVGKAGHRSTQYTELGEKLLKILLTV